MAGLQAGSILQFSVQTTTGKGAETYGLVQTYDVTDGGDRAEALGPDGDTYSIQEHNDKKELSLSYLTLATPVGAPARGTVLDDLGDSITWYVNNVKTTEVIGGFTSVDVSATNYPNLPAAP
jgi:hypothetical protein